MGPAERVVRLGLRERFVLELLCQIRQPSLVLDRQSDLLEERREAILPMPSAKVVSMPTPLPQVARTASRPAAGLTQEGDTNPVERILSDPGLFTKPLRGEVHVIKAGRGLPDHCRPL